MVQEEWQQHKTVGTRKPARDGCSGACRPMEEFSILGAFLVTGGYLIRSCTTSISFLCVTMGLLPGLGSAFLYQIPSVVTTKYFKKLSFSTVIARSGMVVKFLLAPFTKFLIDLYDRPGITKTVSQIISGWVADQNWNYHKSYLILCSITNLLVPLATTFPLLMTYSIFFAIFSGDYLALIFPVLVDLSGNAEVHSFLGLGGFFAGMAVLSGPLIAGNSLATF
ncbi:LOW QUALITY PROTEIN: monocarboxylate transporter 5 [Trichechus inunguis]